MIPFFIYINKKVSFKITVIIVLTSILCVCDKMFWYFVLLTIKRTVTNSLIKRLTIMFSFDFQFLFSVPFSIDATFVDKPFKSIWKAVTLIYFRCILTLKLYIKSSIHPTDILKEREKSEYQIQILLKHHYSSLVQEITF